MGVKSGSWHDWAAMARLPNVPTVWSNVVTAWVLGGGGFEDADRRQMLFLTLVAGSLAYVGGTLLNDAGDVDFDRRFRPERPIPAGRLGRIRVAVTALVCLLAGAVILGMFCPTDLPLWWSTGDKEVFTSQEVHINGAVYGTDLPGCTLLPFLLVAAVLAYTAVHKHVPWLGVLLMGLCRPLLALIVFAIAWHGQEVTIGWLPPAGQLYFVCLWLYVSGISWTALGEVQPWRRKTVGWMLGMLPVLDAVFIGWSGPIGWIAVPACCLALSLYLRRVAAAT
jgi:4-hydroxybenzoate polyprenyltransferase